MREARVRELASWNRSGARSPRTFVPDPRGGLLDARDAPYRAERRHETDEERDAGALDHEHEHSTPSRTRALASALTRPDECDALARRHDPATAPISFGIGQEVHVSFEVLDATTMRCSTRRHQERGPDDAQSNQQQPTHAQPPMLGSPVRHHMVGLAPQPSIGYVASQIPTAKFSGERLRR